MKSQFNNILSYMWHVYKHDTTIKLGFRQQMTHVEFANEVVHLHNIER